MTLLSLDTETGGLTSDHSVLTITLKTFRFGRSRIFPHKQLHILCKPDDGVYRVDPRALTVNGIDLIEHSKEAVPYAEARFRILQYLKEINKGERNKPVLFGHKVEFDKNHLMSSGIVEEKDWRKFVDVREIDTVDVAKFLVFCGLIPETQSLKLSDLAEFLGVTIKTDKVHTSEYDVELAAEVLFALKRMVLRNQKEKK